MKFSDIELPSNRKFGLFFAAIFTLAGGYFFYSDNIVLGSIFIVLAVIFAVLALTKAEILLPLNKLWMRFGLLLGMIVSPIVLGAIFFVIFMPVGAMMRLFGRDELRMKPATTGFWKKRNPDELTADSFKNQF